MSLPRIDCNACGLGQACQGQHCTFVRSSYPAGHVFFHQGDAPQAAHFVSRGLVLLTECDSEGELVRQTLRPAGSLLDAQVAGGLAHRATATASTSVEVCVLALSAFQVWMGPRRSPSRALLDLALAEAHATEREGARTRSSALAKVAGFLLDHSAEGDSHALELQHRMIAGLLGIRAETFSRALLRLRKAGAVVGSRSVRIRDRAVLADFAADASSPD
jgi:CRP-like cAMP-binding protein